MDDELRDPDTMSIEKGKAAHESGTDEVSGRLSDDEEASLEAIL